MKKYSFAIVLLILCSFLSCDNKDDGAKEWDSDPIENYSITPIHGGAVITYTVPEDPELLYIMVEYERNGKIFTTKSSTYKNTITIEGFNTTKKVQVTLYKANQQEERSRPVVLEFQPLDSPVSLAAKSLDFQTGFGGITVSWENISTTEFGVRLMVEDEDGELVTEEMYFSALPRENRAFRGFENKLTKFALSFEDKWGNISDTTYYVTTPFFEIQIPKPYADARPLIPHDNITDYSSAYPFSATWNGVVGTLSEGWFTTSGSYGISMTWDMKQVAKLSRMILHPRGNGAGHIYWQCNILDFEIWGTDKIDPTKLPPADKDYWLDEFSVRNGVYLIGNSATNPAIPINHPLPAGTFKDDWQYLGRHQVTRLTDQAAMDQQNIDGHPFDLPIDALPVRYIRLYARAIDAASPPTANYIAIGEITFFGDNTVPQD